MIQYTPVINSINYCGCDIDVLRLDLIHSDISGNKWFKLKKNIRKARQDEQKTIITFGGAYSNHIAATAAACKLATVNSIAVIRGEETPILNSTLQTAKEKGMQFILLIGKPIQKKKRLSLKNI